MESLHNRECLYALWPKQNDFHFPDDIFKLILFYWQYFSIGSDNDLEKVT